MEPPKEIAASVGVCEVEWWRAEGTGAPESWPGTAPDLLVEIPHGATRRSDFDRLRAQLSPDLPGDLIDFFYVNTDVGAPEYGREAARQFVELGKQRGFTALVVRCLIPRTFIDTNRVADDGEAARERTELNSAISEYVRDPRDAETLLALHARYHEVADRAFEWVCGHGGLALTPHTYAPRSISIESFDEGIARALRAAYEPDRYESWPLRPPVDLITEGPDGRDFSPPGAREALVRRFAALDLETQANSTYRLHPATMAYRYALGYPGQVLCLEVRRDLLAEPFTPFAEMHVPPERAARVARPIAETLHEIVAARRDRR